MHFLIILFVILQVTDDWRAKICDFGSARNTSTAASHVMTKIGVGTTRWCAPEILTPHVPSPPLITGGSGTVRSRSPALSGGSERGPNYTEKVDVFSFGVVLWELVTMQMPYAEYEWEAELLEKIIGGLRYKANIHRRKFRLMITHLTGWWFRRNARLTWRV